MTSELEYGSILPNGEDWRLRRVDAGMGEVDYIILLNGEFFARFEHKEDAQRVMTAMTCSTASAEQVLSNLIAWVKDLRDVAQSNIDGDYGTQNDRAVAVILGQVITKYEEFQQQAQQPGGGK